MSREKLENTLNDLERNFNTLSEKGLNQITKMQNLSQDVPEQTIKVLSLSQNDLEKIAKMRRIKNYKNMSKEELLIALLKSKQSLTKLRKSKSNNAKIEETKKIFNELRNMFSKPRIKKLEKSYMKKKRLKNIKKSNI